MIRSMNTISSHDIKEEMIPWLIDSLFTDGAITRTINDTVTTQQRREPYDK